MKKKLWEIDTFFERVTMVTSCWLLVASITLGTSNRKPATI